MFFRREKTKVATFDDRLSRLKELGFTVQSGSGGTIVAKYGCSAALQGNPDNITGVSKAGVIVGKEIGYLVNGGYQQFFVTDSGRKLPALAQQLRALHDFQEDLKEGLGQTSLYNTSLGTISDRHMYDRVEDRDSGHTKDFGTTETH
ncbi:MAG: hypothetical protein SGI92_24060 [Bryobacteraceae bacterium]|nr:hypothetical protein [Bryobacteraceae bacterium]